MKPLDRIDFEIIDHLQNDARISNKELAGHVGLAPSSCHTRVKALESAGVFQSYRASVDAKFMGVGQQGLYFVSLAQHSRQCCENFLQDMLALPEVVTVFQISGQTDFVIHAMTRDTAALRDFALDNITVRPEVTRFETAIIFNQPQRSPVPRYVDSQ